MVHYLENSSPLWSLLPLFFLTNSDPFWSLLPQKKLTWHWQSTGTGIWDYFNLRVYMHFRILQTSQKMSASRRFTAIAKDRILESKWVCVEIAPWKVSIFYKPCQVSSAMSRTPLNFRAKSKPFATLRHKEWSFFMHVYMYMYMYMCICYICIL
jgi:hypothetical protein